MVTLLTRHLSQAALLHPTPAWCAQHWVARAKALRMNDSHWAQRGQGSSLPQARPQGWKRGRGQPEPSSSQPHTLAPGRFVGYPGNYHTLFGVRNEEVSVLGALPDRKWGLGYLHTHGGLTLLPFFSAHLLPLSKSVTKPTAAFQDSSTFDLTGPRS